MDALIVVLAALVLIIGPVVLYAYCTVEHDTLEVSDKSIKVQSSPIFGFRAHGHMHFAASSVYMVFTADGRAFKNANSILFWKFDSDEMQAKLKTGRRYRIKTSGLRVPILGLYKNIIEADEIK
jgi:hypothetical protein